MLSLILASAVLIGQEDPVWYAHPTTNKLALEQLRADVRALHQMPAPVARAVSQILHLSGAPSTAVRAWLHDVMPPVVGDRFFLIPCSATPKPGFPSCGDTAFQPGLETIIVEQMPGISQTLPGYRLLQPLPALESLSVEGGAWLPGNEFYPVSTARDALLAVTEQSLLPPDFLQPWLTVRSFAWVRQAELLGLLRYRDEGIDSASACTIPHLQVHGDCSLQVDGGFALSAAYALTWRAECDSCTAQEKFGLGIYAASYLMRTRGSAMDLIKLDSLLTDLKNSPALDERGSALIQQVEWFRYWRLQQF